MIPATNSAKNAQAHAPGSHILLTVLGVCIIILAAACGAIQSQEARPAPPADYQLIVEVDLTTQAYHRATLGQFSLPREGEVGLFFTLGDLETAAFDLSIKGTDGSRFGVLQARDYRTDSAGSGEWRDTLPPGEYHLLLTAAQGHGNVAVYANTP